MQKPMHALLMLVLKVDDTVCWVDAEGRALCVFVLVLTSLVVSMVGRCGKNMQGEQCVDGIMLQYNCEVCGYSGDGYSKDEHDCRDRAVMQMHGTG